MPRLYVCSYRMMGVMYGALIPARSWAEAAGKIRGLQEARVDGRLVEVQEL